MPDMSRLSGIDSIKVQDMKRVKTLRNRFDRVYDMRGQLFRSGFMLVVVSCVSPTLVLLWESSDSGGQVKNVESVYCTIVYCTTVYCTTIQRAMVYRTTVIRCVSTTPPSVCMRRK